MASATQPYAARDENGSLAEGAKDVSRRSLVPSYRISTTLAATMAVRTIRSGIMATLRPRPNRCNRGPPVPAARSLATTRLMSSSTAISPNEAANPAVLVIVETVVVVMLETIAASVFVAQNNMVVKSWGPYLAMERSADGQYVSPTWL